jgi:O-antigen biosynthesis protein WbqL
VPVHPHWNFGHFLMEILPRLLLLDRECPRDWPILIARDEPAFIETMLRLACPDRPVVTFDPLTQAVRAPRLTGCSDLITPRSALPALRGLFDDLRDRMLELGSDGAPVAERIFLSRAGVRKRRHVILDGDEIEQAVAAAGYLVVRPEELPFPDQVRLFASARVIAGEYGSALHNAIFARPDTTIVCLNWINPYQSQIASLMGHRIGYIPPQDGRFRTADALWSGDKTMRFDPVDVTTRLAALG